MARCSLVLSFALLLVGGASGARPLSGQSDVRVDSAVAVPMRDGVVLRADRLPSGRRRTIPGAGPSHALQPDRAPPDPLVQAAVRRGYAVVLQDVRGRYGSAGVFEPYRQEGRDGYDTIEWAARQPWSNGAVGTFGLSYPGAVQWLAAVERPPSLRAMVPAMTYSTPESFWYSGGVWDGSWLDWTWLNIAPDLRRRLGVAGPADRRGGRRGMGARGRGGSPIPADARRCRSFKGVAPWYFEWMRHPPGDAWWGWARLAGTVRPGRRRGAQPLRLVRRDVRAERRGGELRGLRGRAGERPRWCSDRGPTVWARCSAARPASGTSAPMRRSTTPGRCSDWMDRHLKGVTRADGLRRRCGCS